METKTGLEGVLGYFSECGTLGKIYGNSLLGTTGTLNCGAGTSADNRIKVGSGMVVCSGEWTAITAGTLAAGSSGSEFVCVGVEAGAAGIFTATGGTGSSVAAAITARAGTTKAPLAYVTVGTSGDVLAGSIVDERTFVSASPISFVTGFDFSVDSNKKDIYNGKAFAHYKAGRQAGKLSVKEVYTEHGSLDVWPATSTYHTVPTIALELALDGIAGTMEQALLFQRVGKESLSFSQPEDDSSTGEISATFGSHTCYA